MNHNVLATASSQYLRQHASNPIHWQVWGTVALSRALAEDKPILVSIGYAACHWCHVMAGDTFADPTVAEFLNTHFICIKVDREERPDLDQLYIAAFQAMGISVGWPLNVFLMPNQKPFYGITYLPPSSFQYLLENILQAFCYNRSELSDSAEAFTQALQGAFPAPTTNINSLKPSFEALHPYLDFAYGGVEGGVKFPMPSINLLVLSLYQQYGDEEALAWLHLTLQNMAQGGIYDHLGGGFARYATDAQWRIPHFEKMLYDNGQLLSVYARAYRLTLHPLYDKVVDETINFLAQEMLQPNGAFASSLDADTDGREGKFYTWTYREVQQILEEESLFVMDCFNILKQGNWEEGCNVLYITDPEKIKAAGQRIQYAKDRLANYRAQRPRPPVDTKALAAWNGMALQGLLDAYMATGKAYYLQLARQNADFIRNHLLHGDALFHSYEANAGYLRGYLDDYAWIIRSFITFYQVSWEPCWLTNARDLLAYTLEAFYDPEDGFFFYAEDSEPSLIARMKEYTDQVVPSANAVMAHNLLFLGTLLNQPSYIDMAEKMIKNMANQFLHLPIYTAYWAHVAMHQPLPLAVVVGPDAQTWAQKLWVEAPLEICWAGRVGEEPIEVPCLEGKSPIEGKTTLYLCHGRVCWPPICNFKEAMTACQALSSNL